MLKSVGSFASFKDNFRETIVVNDQILYYLCAYILYIYISYFANQTVVHPAAGAVEDIDCVLVHTPAQTVWGGTVVAALTSRLCH